MKQLFYEEMADLYFPQQCQCHDDSGSCDWCRVYYGFDKPWIDEEGRELPLPKLATRMRAKTVPPVSPRVDRSLGTPESPLLQ